VAGGPFVVAGRQTGSKVEELKAVPRRTHSGRPGRSHHDCRASLSFRNEGNGARSRSPIPRPIARSTRSRSVSEDASLFGGPPARHAGNDPQDDSIRGSDGRRALGTATSSLGYRDGAWPGCSPRRCRAGFRRPTSSSGRCAGSEAAGGARTPAGRSCSTASCLPSYPRSRRGPARAPRATPTRSGPRRGLRDDEAPRDDHALPGDDHDDAPRDGADEPRRGDCDHAPRG
jgi:hypothetical protein